MRKLLYALFALAILVQYSCGPTHVIVESPAPAPPPPPPPAPEATYQTFYDALNPYGQWIDNPQYGYVWMPNVGPDFKPYATNGNWVYTDGGWTWASNYPWGWATFHYGRWFFEEGYGWMWIPGNEWAPAWVSWRRSPQYYGWAPLGPSVSISVSVGGGYNPPSHYWNFVPQQYVTSPHITNYYVNEQQNVTIINNTTVIHNTTIVNNTVNNTTIVNNTVNNTTIVNNNVSNTHVTVNNYAGGPDPEEVSRVTGAPLHPVVLRESNAPGESMAGGGLAIYRPRVNAAPRGNGGAAVRPAPAHVQPLTNIRPVNTTVYNNNRGPINNTNITNTTTNNTNINNNTTNNTTNVNNNINNSRNNTNITNNNTTNNTANTNVSNNNSNTNVNNRTVVNGSNPSSSAPGAPAGQVAAGRPVPAPAPVTPVNQPVNRPQGQVSSHPPVNGNVAGTSHPGTTATNPNAPKPGTPKGQKPPPKKKKVNPNPPPQN